MPFTIAAFYRFTPLSDPAALREQFLATFSPTDLCGTMLLASEGVNGTMAGSPETIDRLLTMLAAHTGLDRADVKLSASGERPFGRLKLKLKKQIITFRNVTVDPERSGTYIEPQAWNNLIADPDVLLLDTRNHYETKIGTFTGATDPHLDTFSDFVTYVREHLDPTRTPKVAMFCTGGIRCEKASAYILQQGFREVYHLKGGILKYLEEVPPQASTWNGECYTFDRRTSVDHTDFNR